MARKASGILKQLERLRDNYGADAARRKLELLPALGKSSLSSAEEVSRLHEILCLLRAYPDSREVLTQVELMLKSFANRKDLRTHRKALESSGIAGTAIHFAFYWFTACWLARRWPDRISIDWATFDKKNELLEILPLLVPYSETPALDELSLSPREWIERLKGPGETDACFLIRRFKALAANSFGRELSYERLDIPIRLKPGPDTPSRTLARYPGSPVVFQTKPLSKIRATFRDEIRRAPVRVREVPVREGRRLIDLARGAMITRSRDLDAFEHASEKDVRLVSCDRGLQFACIGVVPERRLMFESVYGFLTLKNGVPIGYVLAGSLYHSTESAFNMFETVRGAESGMIYSRVLAMMGRLFGSDSFVVPPYQLGHNNPEALESGAWWFYYKLGFRPRDPDVRRILRGELKKIREDPRHRTNVTTLNNLAAENMFLDLGHPRRHTVAEMSPGDIGSKITRTLADRFGADREKGVRTCSQDAARSLGLRSFGSFSAGEKIAWERWSPLVVLVDGIKHWSKTDKRALIEVIRAKGGQRESRFVELFNKHRRLQNAILRLSAD
ncbi:MAG: hypothetical protein ABIJ00_16175 [Candidatus Eisenbacteria bacterium]